MALYQPTNITPDLISGAENGVVIVNPGGNVEVSWSVNGNSPLLAYRIEFFRNDAASTPGADTGKITLNDPFYGKDANGNEQRFSVSLPFGYFTIASMSPNKHGKIRITQWWGSSDTQSVAQRSLSVFRTSPNTTADVDDAVRQTDGSYLFSAAVNLPSYVVYGECSVLWTRWEIINIENGETVEDTGVIWGASEYEYQTALLLPGQYVAAFSFETSFGQTVRAESSIITVDSEELESYGISAQCDSANSAVLLTARFLEQYIGDYSGAIAGDQGFIVNDTDGYGEIEFPVVSSEPWGFLWEGSVWQSESVLASKTAFRLTLANGTIVRFGFLEAAGGSIVPVLNPTQGGEIINIQQFEFGARVRIAFVRTSDTEYSWCFGAFESGGGTYDHTDWSIEQFVTSPPVKLELFYNSKTTAFSILFGQDGIDVIQTAINSGANLAPVYAPSLILNPATFSATAEYFGGAINGTIWRGQSGQSGLMKVAELSGAESFSWLDYAPGNGKEYFYRMSAVNSDGETITAQTPNFTPCFWDWLLIEAQPSSAGFRGDYYAVNVFKFNMNFNSGADGNGASPGVYPTFTPYPLVMNDTQNRHSGTLSGLIGQMTEPGNYSVTNETRDALRALSANGNPLFLRSRRGDFLRVAISGEITVSVQDNAQSQPLTASVPWVEVGPVDGSVLSLQGGGPE